MPAPARFFFKRIFPYVFVAVGAVTLYFGVRRLLLADASDEWPSAAGHVVASTVESHRSSGDNSGGTTYRAEVLYEFSVGGTTYKGHRVRFGDYGSSNPSHAQRLVNRYPEGRAVTVYYAPNNPEESVLEPGLNGSAWALPAIGFVFFSAGALMAIFLPRLLDRSAPPKGGRDSTPGVS